MAPSAETGAAQRVLPSTTWQQYSAEDYDVPVDPKQGDRATAMRWRSLKRPHMRTFYVSTFGYFAAFLCWFSFAPLMPEVEKTLGLSKAQVYNANIAAVAATVAGRFAVGPLCDTFGARVTFASVLAAGSIPSFFSGLVQNANELAVVRFFIGFLGACFVCNQVWASQIFAKEIVGFASATSAGWGNLGGGLTQLLMVVLFAALKTGTDSETAWRVSFVIPSALVLLSAVGVLLLADDCPKGNFKELIAKGAMVRKSSKKSAAMGYRNINSWLLATQYAASLGMELTVTNVAATYFHDKFALSTFTAGLIATLFGFMNIFSRSLGGQLSDILARVFGHGTLGMRGRFIAHFCCLMLEGVTLITFSRMNTLAGSICLLVLFSLGVQMSSGSNFAIEATGAVSGVVGAGGNMGAIFWGLLFRFGPAREETCFLYLGYIVLGIACLTPLINIKGYRSCLRRAQGEPAAIDAI